MKKKIFLILITLLSIISIHGQEPEVDQLYIRQDGQVFFNGDPMDWELVMDSINTKVSEGAFVQPIDSLLLNPNIPQAVRNDYKIFADSITGLIGMFNKDQPGNTYINATASTPFYNSTNDTLLPGIAVSGDTSYVNGIRVYISIQKTDKRDLELARTFVGLCRDTIYPQTVGIVNRFNIQVISTAAWSVKDRIFVDTAGLLTNEEPMPPDYIIFVGEVAAPNLLAINATGFDGSDTDVNLQGSLNGVVTQKPGLHDTIISNVLYAEIFNDEYNNRDLPFMYNLDRYTLNTTYNTGTNGYARIALDWGNDSIPLLQYVYINNPTTTPVLAKSSSGYPDNFPRIIAYGVYSQSKHETEGFAYVRRVNDAVDGSNANGLFSKITRRIRLLGSIIDSGVEPTIEIVTSAGLDTLKVSTTSGIGYQLNSQIIEALEGPYTWWFSPNGGDSTITSLSEVNIATDGTSLRANNTRYRLNVFLVINSGDYSCKLCVTASNGVFSTDQNCVDNIGGKSVTTPPNYMSDISVRLLAIPLRYTTSSGGTIINLIDLLEGGTGGYQDEKNFPFGYGGTGALSGTGADFPASDAIVNIYNNADPTKSFEFDVSNVTTGTTRTLTVPDVSDTLVTNNMQSDLNTNGNNINIENGDTINIEEYDAFRDASGCLRIQLQNDDSHSFRLCDGYAFVYGDEVYIQSNTDYIRLQPNTSVNEYFLVKDGEIILSTGTPQDTMATKSYARSVSGTIPTDSTWNYIQVEDSAQFNGAVKGVIDTLSFSVTLAANYKTGSPVKLVTMTNNSTITVSNVPYGLPVDLIVVQDATGSRTITWSGVTQASGDGGTANTGANDITLYQFMNIGGVVYYWTMGVKD